MPYKLSREADKDLIEIYLYGSLNFGEIQAEKYFSELLDCFQLLAETPFMCREHSEFSPAVRVHHHRSHLIIYLIQNDLPLILRILHEKRDIRNHLPDT